MKLLLSASVGLGLAQLVKLTLQAQLRNRVRVWPQPEVEGFTLLKVREMGLKSTDPRCFLQTVCSSAAPGVASV